MKKHLIFASLAFMAAAALAADPRVENMAGQCNAVMARGVCRVALDAKDYPNETILISEVGRIKTAAYLKIQNTGEKKNADGSWLMCTLVRDVCTASWDGDECKAARALWRQEPPK